MKITILHPFYAGRTESGKTTMLTPGGHGPPRIHGNDISKEVATHFLSEFKS